MVKNLDGVLLKFKLEDDILVFKGANRRYFKDLKVGQILNQIIILALLLIKMWLRVLRKIKGIKMIL